jgi:ATP-dependent RNA helicase DeaD
MSDNPAPFSSMSLAPALLSALKAVGYEQPSPVQAACIPLLLNGSDVLATAQTGTGKTAAFALPLLSRIDLSLKAPQILVLAPTRELAIQVAKAFESYAQHMQGFNVLAVYGGQAMDGQLRQLRRGAHVIVGTPGRVMDHLRRKSLKLNQLQAVVLDEADEMLRMGFIDDVAWILEQTPEQKQVALFSATMPKPIRKIADTYTHNAKSVAIESATQTVEAIEQVCWTVRGLNKLDALTRLLETEDTDAIIVFVRTKTVTVEVADNLERRGFRASPINGDMSQHLRERTIEKLKQGSVDILVATDVAARGIDVTRVSHVINYDMPYDADVYVHRIGRTGRAGRSGKAILFVTPRENRLLRVIEKHTRQKIEPIELPSQKQVQDKRIERFKQRVVKQLGGKPVPQFAALVETLIEENNVTAEELSTALLAMAQKANPLLAEEKKRKPQKEFSDSGQFKRDSKKPSQRKGRKFESDKQDTGDMESYQLSVGREQQVSVGDIVGAIANEAGISSQYIGRIKLGDNSSTVDLPAGMPKDVFQQLKKVRIRNHPIGLEKSGESGGNFKRPSRDKKSNAGKNKRSANADNRAVRKAPGKRGKIQQD